MYIKWIICEVKQGFEKEFSLAQEKWSEIKNVEGFIGQLGGWDLKQKNTACVISFWKNKESLDAFMQFKHDKIFLENKQSEYYTSIEVEHFNSILSMEGECNTLPKAMKEAKLIRIADCIVIKDRVGHFEKVQKEIWLPEMKNSIGMLGGKFSRSNKNSLHYLVSTFWSSEVTHNNYIENKLPKLKEIAGVKSDIFSILGKQVELVDSWKVIKTTANKKYT